MLSLGYMVSRAAARYPDHIALICGDRILTFRDLERRSNALANGLISLGVGKGDRVGIVLRNSTEYVEAEFAVYKSGGVTVPVNVRYTPKEMTYILNDAEVRVVVAASEFIDGLREERLEGSTIVCVGKRSPVTHDYERLINSRLKERPWVEVGSDDLATLKYTSGTTGQPKGAMISHRALASLTNNLLLDRLDVRPGDVMLHSGPLTHATGVMTLPHFIKGATNIILERFDPDGYLEAIERHHATTLYLVPTMLTAMVNHPALERRSLKSVHTVNYGASPVPAGTLRRALDIMGPIFAQGYGLSEAALTVTVLGKSEHVVDGPPELVNRLTSVGRELTNMQVRVLNDVGREVKPGEVGEIVVRGDQVMHGYWRREAETEEVLRDGWLYTRDLATLDSEGYIYLVDRKGDMIISGGFNVYPREVEDALSMHPAVLETAVIGVPDARWGEAVKAVVVLKRGAIATEQDLVEHCRERIAGYKKPRSIDFVSSLPKSPAGKILRRILREPYWQGCDRHIN